MLRFMPLCFNHFHKQFSRSNSTLKANTTVMMTTWRRATLYNVPVYDLFQAEIHTCFHRFTEIGQIFHN